MKNRIYTLLFIMLAAVLTGSTHAIDYYLRADVTNLAMPDGSIIPAWGFAQDPDAVQETGVVTVPGPSLTIPDGDNTLTIHLKNRLSEPVSVVIPALPAVMAPVRFPPGDPDYPDRLRNLTEDTPPGNAVPVDYQWNNVRPGSFIYHSGNHIAVQVQMGLYGAVTKNTPTGEAYPGNAYDNEVLLFYSEIDPMVHIAAATGAYGPGQSMTSTINYHPKYFLVNGQPYAVGQLPIPAGQVGQTTLLRLFNAGLETHVVQLQNLRGTFIAEDAWPRNYSTDQHSFVLQAGKTKDLLLNPTTAGSFPVYDRRLRLTNANASPGGLLSFLQISGAGPLSDNPADFDNSGSLDMVDLAILMENWLQPCVQCPYDLNGDSSVNLVDVQVWSNAFRITTGEP